jgi:glycosyltransferase involved in cell wall biosynthesis
MKIAVVTPIPTPYRDPFLSALAAYPGVELDVFYCAASKADRPWEVDWKRKYTHEVLKGYNLLEVWKDDASLYLNVSVVRTLRRKPYQAILVGGYNHPTMLMALAYGHRASIPCYMMCETWRRNRKRGVKSLIQRHLVDWSFRRVRGGLPTGSLASEYLVKRGIPEAKQYRLPNVPDIKAIEDRMQSAKSMRVKLREKWKLSDKHVTLFVGRWIPKKRVVQLVEAFARLRDCRDRRLVLVGDGPERVQVEATVKHHDLSDVVLLPGFLQPDEIMDWYAAVDVFVLPSAETWGVSAIEAAAAGLPIVLSDQAGCHPDLAAAWPATRVYSGGDLDALSESLATPPTRPEPPVRLTDWHHGVLAAGLAEFLISQKAQS